jgi:hypothetical protein
LRAKLYEEKVAQAYFADKDARKSRKVLNMVQCLFASRVKRAAPGL